jgi:hypothetical protein
MLTTMKALANKRLCTSIRLIDVLILFPKSLMLCHLNL